MFSEHYDNFWYYQTNNLQSINSIVQCIYWKLYYLFVPETFVIPVPKLRIKLFVLKNIIKNWKYGGKTEKMLDVSDLYRHFSYRRRFEFIKTMTVTDILFTNMGIHTFFKTNQDLKLKLNFYNKYLYIYTYIYERKEFVCLEIKTNFSRMGWNFT